MVIGLFCDTYPPEIDGVGIVVQNYAKNLSAMGDQCYVVSPQAPPGYDDVQRNDSYEILHFKGMKVPKAPQYRAGIPSWDFSYLHQTRKIKMDLLHAHSPFGGGFEAVRLARIHDIPLVGTFHSKYYDDFYSVTRSQALSQAGVKIILSFYNACDEVWTVNALSSEVLRGYGYKGEIVVMPNGTDIWYPTPEDGLRVQQMYNLGDGPVLLFVGQQHWKKNVRHIVEALSRYKTMQPGFRMVMVGQGPHEKEIQALVEELGLQENFVFTGQLMERDILHGLYARADMLVFPSLYDTAGLVVGEAAAAGTPSLVVRGSCAAGVIREGENGFLCEDEPENICSVIAHVLQDKDALRRVGEHARDTIPMPWRSIILSVRERYFNLLNKYDARTMMKG